MEKLKNLLKNIKESLNNINLSIFGKRRKRIRHDRISQFHLKKVLDAYKEQDVGLKEFYETYVEETPTMDTDIDLDELVKNSDFGILNKYSKNLTYMVFHTKFLPSKIDFQYAGIRNVRVYFLKVIIMSIVLGIMYALFNMSEGNMIMAILEGIFAGVIFLIAGVFYPKLKLYLFRGEIKIQILITILNMISSLNSGLSLQEAMHHISENPEYGIPSFEFRNIIYDINRGGYSFKEALERARLRTKIDLMKKLYSQLIMSADKGGGQLLLKNLYNETIRESLSKIDSLKFQISNLGNLVFGVGMILPFSGMLLSSLQGGGGFEGIISTTDVLLTKIAPVATAIFAVFIKMKIE